MALGDRLKNGKPKDIVSHYFPGDPNFYPVCGQKVYWYSTAVKSEVTCKKCLKALNEHRKSPTPHF